jgi:hypothetical protein
MAQLQPYVSNVPLQVAKNLRFLDSNGIPVTELLPIGMNGTIVADSPTTGYISCIGAAVSSQIDLYNNVSNTLIQYGQDISTLQSEVAALQASGTTIPVVNGYCFSNNVLTPITTITELIAQNSCDYNTVLGTTSALASSVLVEAPGTLNSLPAFSQNSAMAGLSGWVSNPLTIADAVNNLWLSYLDSRAGVSKAINAVIPTCSQVIVDFQPVYSSSLGGFNIYFSGYSFIPSGYGDNGSTITITDGKGGILEVGFSIVEQAASTNPLFIASSGSALSPIAASYQVEVMASVSNAGIGSNCVKTVIRSTQSAQVSNSIGAYIATISGTVATIPIVAGLSYNPSMVYPTAGNAYTGTLLQANAYYISYVSGGANLNFVTPPDTGNGGVIEINWAAYKSG